MRYPVGGRKWAWFCFFLNIEESAKSWSRKTCITFDIDQHNPLLVPPERSRGSCLQARKNSGMRQRAVESKVKRLIIAGRPSIRTDGQLSIQNLRESA